MAFWVRDVVPLRIFLVRYPIVTIKLLFICPKKTAAFAFEAEVMHTVDVSAV